MESSIGCGFSQSRIGWYTGFNKIIWDSEDCIWLVDVMIVYRVYSKVQQAVNTVSVNIEIFVHSFFDIFYVLEFGLCALCLYTVSCLCPELIPKL